MRSVEEGGMPETEDGTGDGEGRLRSPAWPGNCISHSASQGSSGTWGRRVLGDSGVALSVRVIPQKLPGTADLRVARQSRRRACSLGR